MMMQQLQAMFFAPDGSDALTGKISFPLDNLSIYINRPDVATDDAVTKRYSFTVSDLFGPTPSTLKYGNL